MLPVSNTPASVAVCAIESEFNQFTVWPTFTITGFGENTPFLIVTVSRLGGFTHSGFVGVGVHPAVGLVVVVGLDELHPIAKSASRMTAVPIVDRVVLESLKIMPQRTATPVPSRQAGPPRPHAQLSEAGIRVNRDRRSRRTSSSTITANRIISGGQRAHR
jgi:hypothetical protein